MAKKLSMAEQYLQQDQEQQSEYATPEDSRNTMTQAEVFLSDQNRNSDGLVEYATNPEYRSKVHEGVGIATGYNPASADDNRTRPKRMWDETVVEGVPNAYTGARAGVNAVGDFVTDAVDWIGDTDIGGFEQRKKDLRTELPENSVAGALGDEIAQMYLGGKAADAMLGTAGVAYKAVKNAKNAKADAPLNGYTPSANVPNSLHPNRYDTPGVDHDYSGNLIKKAAKVIERDKSTKNVLPATKAETTKLEQTLDGTSIAAFDKAKQIERAKNSAHSTQAEIDDAVLRIEQNYNKSPEAISLENVINKRNHEGINLDPRIFNKSFDKKAVRESDFLSSYNIKRLMQSGTTKGDYGDRINKLIASKKMSEMAKGKAVRAGNRDARIEAERQISQIQNKIDETVELQQGAPSILESTKRSAIAGGAGHLVFPGGGALIGTAPTGIRLLEGRIRRVGRNSELQRIAKEAGIPAHRLAPYIEKSYAGRLGSAINRVGQTPTPSIFTPSATAGTNTALLGSNAVDQYFEPPEPEIVKTKKKTIDKATAEKYNNFLNMDDDEFNRRDGRY